MEPGFYSFVFERATWGDGNFGKYLKDPTSIPASSCRVNVDGMRQDVNVDNDAAAGVTVIHIDNSAEPVIYDLTGRRLKSMSKPGLYIVHGKKVMKR